MVERAGYAALRWEGPWLLRLDADADVDAGVADVLVCVRDIHLDSTVTVRSRTGASASQRASLP